MLGDNLLINVLICLSFSYYNAVPIIRVFFYRQLMNVSADDIVITNIENLANDLIAITFFVRGMYEDLISGQTVLEAVQVYLCK